MLATICVDLMPGLTWHGQAGAFSWGAQGTATIPLGDIEGADPAPGVNPVR